MKTRSS